MFLALVIIILTMLLHNFGSVPVELSKCFECMSNLKSLKIKKVKTKQKTNLYTWGPT